MKLLISLFSLAFLFSCSTSKTVSPYSMITYEAGACYGTCPVYKMTINPDRTALFEADRFNFSKDTPSEEPEGNFRGTIDTEKYNQLISMIDRIQPKNLKDSYGNTNVSDLPTSYLTITYQDGTVKKIKDYGKYGTPGLEKVYQLFDELTKNQTWTKIE